MQLELNEPAEERVNPSALNSSGNSTPTTVETSNLDTSVSETPSGDLSDDSTDDPSHPQDLRRSERGRIPRRRFPIEGESSSLLALFAGDPSSVEEAMKQQEWKEAMESELKSIEKNQTWELVNLPEGKNVIGLKWIFKTKFLADGSIQKCKARPVVRGYAQQHGIDYEETFSPVARFETVRVILALAAQKRWKVFQFDVKSAFLNGDLEEEVYVSQPPGFEKPTAEDKVFRLKKALYGLKQAPRAWYSKIDGFFHKNGFERSMHEPTLYLKNQGGDNFMIVSLYVDDMIYTGSSLKLISEFKESMKRMFDMTDLGELKYFLGLEVSQTDGGIFMSQRKFVKDTLERFNMLNCKVANTPMNTNEKLRSLDETGKADASLYRSLIGRLIYVTHSRPDVSFAVGVLSRFMHNPSRHHLGAAKRVLRYLAGTINFGIWYRKVENFSLKGYSDSDWGGSAEDGRSTTGNCFLLGSAAVCWSSKKQATIALSTTEAEYVAVTATSCQAVWLRRLMGDIGMKQNKATEIFCDNESAIMLGRNPVFHSRTKHIEIKHHFVRELVAKGEVKLESCGTKEQPADLMTKSLPFAKHEKFCIELGLSEFE